VFFRPGLETFLRRVSECFELVLFSDVSEEFAKETFGALIEFMA